MVSTCVHLGAILPQDNAIAMISVCRDEFTREIVESLDEFWGQSFSMGSIAGMVNMGKTGMGAGMAHAPICPDGVERYVFVSAPHIAISEKGEIGKCYRPGRKQINVACGALLAMLGELQDGKLQVEQCWLLGIAPGPLIRRRLVILAHVFIHPPCPP